jgi:hypothetical protein
MRLLDDENAKNLLKEGLSRRAHCAGVLNMLPPSRVPRFLRLVQDRHDEMQARMKACSPSELEKAAALAFACDLMVIGISCALADAHASQPKDTP